MKATELPPGLEQVFLTILNPRTRVLHGWPGCRQLDRARRLEYRTTLEPVGRPCRECYGKPADRV